MGGCVRVGLIQVPEGHTDVQEAVEGIELVLADTDSTAALAGAPRAWLEACTAVLPKVPAETASNLASDIFR